jgi:hypothetical protein
VIKAVWKHLEEGVEGMMSADSLVAGMKKFIQEVTFAWPSE